MVAREPHPAATAKGPVVTSRILDTRPPSTGTPSRGPRRLLAVAAAAALTVGIGATGVTPARAASPSFCADGSQPYAPVAEVEAFAAGTPVTGLSVTHGTTPDAFTGTYVGFIDNALGKDKDLLLFRLSSPVIDGTDGLKPAGIWAGMSGSPVYDGDGRLIGAVSYSLNADNLPIAGVTPAEYMRTIGTTAVGTASTIRTTSTGLKVSAAGTAAAGASLTGTSFSPIRTVKVAGTAGTRQNAFTNRTLARTPRTARSSAFLRSGGFLPAPAVSASAVPEPLVAGGTVAALYSSGDLLTGAVGTVTAVCGDTVWAFGHPMDYTGRTSMLMANASTALIVPDSTGSDGSYKQVSQFGAPLGMITQDRFVGIRGTVGDVEAFGVEVAVQGPSGTPLATYSGDLASQELTPSAVAYLVGTAAMEQLDQYGAGTGRLSWTISYRRADGSSGTFTNSQVVADSSWFLDEIGTPPAEDAWAIVDNEFEEVDITGVQVTLTLLDDDAISYAPSGIQLRDAAGTWRSPAGVKLTHGRTYTVRPTYTVKTNGRSTGTTHGDPVTFTLSSKARRSASFTVAAVNRPGDVCETDADGFTLCTSWDVEEDGSGIEASDFDELVALLDEYVPDDAVVASLRYKLKKGSSSRTFGWTGPGVVEGSSKTNFTVR